jgi:hypothetical protein
LSTQKEAFGARPNYNEWISIGGSESQKATLDSRVSSFIAGICGSLLSGVDALALALLQPAREQFTKMVGFIDWFYQELTQVAKFPEEPAWLLVGRCVGAVFDAMSSIRAQVSRLPEPTAELHTKHQLIWAVLQCNRVIEDFSKVQFRGHTATVKEMSLFMLAESVNPTRLVGILQLVWDAEQAASNAKAEVVKLNTKFTTFGTDVATLKREHKELQNAYKQTEQKVDKG